MTTDWTEGSNTNESIDCSCSTVCSGGTVYWGYLPALEGVGAGGETDFSDGSASNACSNDTAAWLVTVLKLCGENCND